MRNGLNQLARALVFASGVLMISSSLALADAPPNAPIVPAPGSNAATGGPTVWNQDQEVSALTGPRTVDPEFLAKGIPMGVFRLFTDLATDVSYDSNVFRVENSAKSDVFFTETPSLILDYETNEAHADLYADATFNQYLKQTTVNNDEYDFGLRGSYLITREAQFNGNVSYSQLAEPLSSPDVIAFQDRPNLYNLFDASGQFKYQPNRLGFIVGGSDDVYTYQNTPTFGGGEIGNADRNNTIYKGFVEADYDFSPGYSAFARGTYNSDQYSHYFDRTGTHRSSTGYQADAGVKLLLGNLIQGSMYLGYVDQVYDHHQANPLSDISGLDFGADLNWYPTELLTVNLTAARQIENTTLNGASGGDDRSVDLSANYEVTRRVLLTANVGYDDTKFQGSIPYQDDKTPTAGAGLKFLISHYVQATLSYQYTTRTSTEAGLKYNDNLATLSVNWQI
jgi:hypothetical protein